MSPLSSSLVATTWVRSLTGDSQAQQACIAGRPCAIKYRSHHRSSRPLINEWLGGRLLRLLGFPAAEVACVDLGGDYNQNGAPPHLRNGNQYDFVPSTGHLASFYPVRSAGDRLYDFLPDLFLHNASNLAHLIGVLAADLWLGSTGYRQAVFHRTSSSDPFVATLIDNNGLFGGETWTFSLRECHYMRHWIYNDPRTLDLLGKVVHLVQTLPGSSLEDSIRSVPACWSEGEELALENMYDTLTQRRAVLPELLDEYLHKHSLIPGLYDS